MHLLLLGTIGTGKTTTMAGCIMQDIAAGNSFTLIDTMGASTSASSPTSVT